MEGDYRGTDLRSYDSTRRDPETEYFSATELYSPKDGSNREKYFQTDSKNMFSQAILVENQSNSIQDIEKASEDLLFAQSKVELEGRLNLGTGGRLRLPPLQETLATPQQAWKDITVRIDPPEDSIYTPGGYFFFYWTDVVPSKLFFSYSTLYSRFLFE